MPGLTINRRNQGGFLSLEWHSEDGSEDVLIYIFEIGNA